MNLTTTIESAELRFKQILEEFFIGRYDEKVLPSHGIEHHRRVWKYAGEIALLLAEYNKIYDPDLLPRLIIACYLHDIGMAIDPGVKHGHHSRELCLLFLQSNNLNPSDFPDVLDAIENHDNKEYSNSSGKHDLLTILSVADDLDAFGFTGIFRYTEIYLTRGFNPSEIGYMIIENATKRFDNFAQNFEFSNAFCLRHKRRFDILSDFFGEYNKEISSYKFNSDHPSGYCGVIEVINDAVKSRVALESLLNGQLKFSPDIIIKWFIKGIQSDSLNWGC